MARKSATKKRSGSGARRDIMKLDAVGTKELVRKQRNKSGWTTQYRCSLSGTVWFFAGLNLRQVHLECMKRTPFYNFVIPFVKGKYTVGSVRGMQDGTMQMLMSYNRDKNCFTIGGKDIAIEPREFDVIFGIKSGHVPIRLRRTSKSESSLAMRKFRRFKKVRPGELKGVLKTTLSGDTEQDISDSVRLIIVHLLSNIFFIAGGDCINMWFFRVCDNLELLSTYNWGQAVVNYLMKSIQKRTAERVRGCTVLFMYWLCEHMKLVNPPHPEALPRFRKWRLKDMGDALSETALKDIQPDQVRHRPIIATIEEEAFLNSHETNGTGRELDDNSDSEYSPHESNNDEESDGGHVVSDSDNHMEVDLSGLAAEEYNGLNTHSEGKGTYRDAGSGAAGKVLYADLTKRIAELQTQVSMLEAELDERRSETYKWKEQAVSLGKKNDLLEDEIDRLIRFPTLNETERSYGARLQSEIDDLKKAIRDEIREKIELRADLRKAEVENEKLQDSYDLLASELEELKELLGKKAPIEMCHAEEQERSANASKVNMSCNGAIINEVEEGVDITVIRVDEDISLEDPHHMVGSKDNVEPFTPVNERNSQMVVANQEPSWKLMSQLDDPVVDIHEDPNSAIPLTYMSPTELEIIDLHTSINLMRAKENEYLRKLSDKDAEIDHLSKMLQHGQQPEQQVVIGLPAQRNGNIMVHAPVGMHDKTPESAPANRTRAKKSVVTPISMNEKADMGKNYKKFHVYLKLPFDAQRVIDDLVTSHNKTRHVLWQSEDGAVCVLIPDVFLVIQKKELSNNVIDSYSRILMLEQRKDKLGNSVENDASWKCFVFDSLLLQRMHISGNDMFELPPDLEDYRYLIFPMLHKRDSHSRADHWTVLVVDYFNGDFNLYNSLSSKRKSSDKILADAKKLQDALYRTGRHLDADLPYDEDITVVEDAPQQQSSSVDCGVVVLYVINKHFMNEPMAKKLNEKDAIAMRASIVNTFVKWGMSVGTGIGKRPRGAYGEGPSS